MELIFSLVFEVFNIRFLVVDLESYEVVFMCVIVEFGFF